jgi:coatomer subunit beta
MFTKIHFEYEQEADAGCRRNAFTMLINVKPNLAVQYLMAIIAQVPAFDEVLQLAAMELIRKDCRNPQADKVELYSFP